MCCCGACRLDDTKCSCLDECGLWDNRKHFSVSISACCVLVFPGGPGLQRPDLMLVIASLKHNLQAHQEWKNDLCLGATGCCKDTQLHPETHYWMLLGHTYKASSSDKNSVDQEGMMSSICAASLGPGGEGVT